MSFPLTFKEPFLEQSDFNRFSQSFSRIVLKKIPTADSVSFFSTPTLLIDSFDDTHKRDSLNDIFVGKDGLHDLAVSVQDSLVFSIPIVGSEHALILVKGIDQLVARRIGEDWLADMRESLLTEFALLKQARVDVETGLFNYCNLNYLLESFTDYNQVGLILVDLPTKGTNVDARFRHVKKASKVLQQFSGVRFPVHHLGQSVYAMVPILESENELPELGALLVKILKREGFNRVYVGCAKGDSLNLNDESTILNKQKILEESWAALKIAAKRGPFSFCEYDVVANPEKHPLCKPADTLTRFFQRAWRKEDNFSVVQFIEDRGCTVDALKTLIKKYDRNAQLKIEKASLYLYLPKSTSTQAKKYVEELMKELSLNLNEQNTFSAGIASYPFIDFRKTETLINTKKALLHGEFYGAGAIVVFDEVSLNISGDIYYAEGDLTKAVLEYRKGLLCNDKDVNLLNSLGATYAFMGKNALAAPCFEKALTLEPNNFMALYNSGLEAERKGCINEAIGFLEKAVQVCTVEVDDSEMNNELEFSLGRLCCQAGFYQKAYMYLQRVNEKDTKNINTCKIPGLLGQACYGLKKQKDASRWLQKALQIDEFDAESLSLLGKLYHEDRQGDDIALSFCEKSVDLQPGNIKFRLRLALVQMRNSLLEDAKKNIQFCLRHKQTRVEAASLMVEYYKKKDNNKRVAYWQRKLK